MIQPPLTIAEVSEAVDNIKRSIARMADALDHVGRYRNDVRRFDASSADMDKFRAALSAAANADYNLAIDRRAVVAAGNVISRLSDEITDALISALEVLRPRQETPQ